MNKVKILILMGGNFIKICLDLVFNLVTIIYSVLELLVPYGFKE